MSQLTGYRLEWRGLVLVATEPHPVSVGEIELNPGARPRAELVHPTTGVPTWARYAADVPEARRLVEAEVRRRGGMVVLEQPHREPSAAASVASESPPGEPGARPVADAGTVPADPPRHVVPSGEGGTGSQAPPAGGPGESSAVLDLGESGERVPSSGARSLGPSLLDRPIPWVDWAGRTRSPFEEHLQIPPEPEDHRSPFEERLQIPPEPEDHRCDWCGTTGATVEYPGEEWYHPACAGDEFLRSTDHLSPSGSGPGGPTAESPEPVGQEAWDAALQLAELEQRLADARAELDEIYRAAEVLDRPARVRCGFVVRMLEVARG